jgi:hypothetical protein
MHHVHHAHMIRPDEPQTIMIKPQCVRDMGKHALLCIPVKNGLTAPSRNGFISRHLAASSELN